MINNKLASVLMSLAAQDSSLNFGANPASYYQYLAATPAPYCGVDVAPMENFDLERYTGTWFIQKPNKDVFWQNRNWACSEARYNAQPDGTVEVINSSQLDGDLKQTNLEERTYFPGSARCDPGLGQCYVSFPGLPAPEYSNYIVAYTDYDNYAIVYSCQERDLKKLVTVLSRDSLFDFRLHDEAIQKVTELVPGYDLDRLYAPYQGDKCTYANW
uniref:Lipocalin/cytosolic fatty-acid binding domain-containing protein n=1 Tax=Strombidium rassoulzadegani TaxID=1082188 RepID=A0A7S3CRL8_9SPIT|mmetsp:Transcript_232/g.422  ORF Transcript_232/g.422 Transcript_232/m.422 type:complete len:215 (+) Transcript_232:37-681(+)